MVSFIKKYKSLATFGGIYAVVLYSLMMTQQLTNTYDGLWHQNYRQANSHELSLGRWCLLFLDKMCMGLHADPVISLAALALFVFGFILVIDLFDIHNKLAGFLALTIWISTTTVCNTLSYRMTSFGYAMAYFLAIAAVYALIRINHKVISILVAGMCLSLAMACYQAYLGVFCIVVVFYCFYLCVKEKTEDLFRFLLKCVGTAITGAVFYVFSLTFFLKLLKVSLSDYNNVGGITALDLILNLPENICKTYQYFTSYFFSDLLKVNAIQGESVFYALFTFFLVTLTVISKRMWENKRMNVLLLVVLATVIPIACNAYMLLAGNKLEFQMTAGLAMVAPLIILMAFDNLRENKFGQRVCIFLSLLLLYGNSMQVWIDQESMYEGRNASETIAAQIITDLKAEDKLSKNYEYFFVGVPARNEYFSVSEIYSRANGYAQMGNFWVSGSCNQMSYNGLLQKKMGFNLPMSYLNYEEYAQQAIIGEMPVFPNEGYIQLIDDHVVVIKISEYEKYREYTLYEKENY